MSCTACKIHETVSSVCMGGKGNPSSELFMVFDRPTSQEDNRAAPFVNSGAALFFELIKKSGLNFPDDCYLTYVVKCALLDPKALDLKKDSNKVCPDLWLQKEILKYRPKVVMVVGAEAMSLLLEDKTGILKHRGTFFEKTIEDHTFKVIPTLSPFYLRDKPELEHQVISDIKRAFSAVKNGLACWSEDKIKDLNYRVVGDITLFNEMYKEITDKKIVACDIETRGLDPYKLKHNDGIFPLVSIQFSTGPKSGWFLPLSHSNWTWDSNEFKEIVSGLKDIFESGNYFIIGHNFKFDSKWIFEHLGIKVKLNFDTMLASGLFGETTNGLKKLAWQYTDLGGYEEAQQSYADSLEEDKKWDMYYYPFEELAKYGCCDSDVTYRLFEIFDKKLDENPKLKNIFLMLVKASRAFLDIEHYGFKVNTEYLKQLDTDLNLEIKNLEDQFKNLAIDEIAEIEDELVKEATLKSGKISATKPVEFNIASNDHIKRLFYDKLCYEIDPYFSSKKTGEPSSGKGALQGLQNKYPIAGVLLNHRTISKQISSFVEAYPRFIDKNDRIHSTYSLIKYYNEDSEGSSGTATGRMSCSDPNLQQVPSREQGLKIKKLFIPDYPEHLLVDADFSGIELRVTAMHSQDPTMKNFFNSDGSGDYHSYTAAKVFKKDIKDITKQERMIAKTTNFAILYGGGPNKIAFLTGMKIKEAERFIDQYFQVFPTLKRWMSSQKMFAQKNLYCKSLFGRIRQLPNANSPNSQLREAALRIALNSPIQSDASDLTLHSLNRIHKYLDNFNHFDLTKPTQLKASVHDSIVLSVHKNDLEEIITHIKTQILEAPDLDFINAFGVQLACEIAVGKNWGSTEKVEFE